MPSFYSWFFSWFPLAKLLPHEDYKGTMMYPPFLPPSQEKTKGSSVLKKKKTTHQKTTSLLQIPDYFVSLINDLSCPLLLCFLTRKQQILKKIFLSAGAWMGGSSKNFCAYLLHTYRINKNYNSMLIKKKIIRCLNLHCISLKSKKNNFK